MDTKGNWLHKNKEIRTRNVDNKTQVVGKLNSRLTNIELEHQLLHNSKRIHESEIKLKMQDPNPAILTVSSH